MAELWRLFAACRGMDPDLFHPENKGDAARIRRICSTCPAQKGCLQYAVDHQILAGWWGGKSEQERRELVKGKKRLTPIAHGTVAGYNQHRRRGVPACEPCLEARRVYMAVYKESRREGAA